MGASAERAAEWHATSAHSPEALARSRAEHAEASERMRWDFRRQQERLRQVAAAVAATENSVAATLHELAERALRGGRPDKAQRLESEAEAALRAAERERQRADQPLEPLAGTGRTADADELRARAVRARDEAARQRDDAARRRDNAARQRDRAARQRDEVASVRTTQGDDRAAAGQDRRAAAQDRRAAAQDRAAARADREAAARDRAAAAADRAGAHIDVDAR